MTTALQFRPVRDWFLTQEDPLALRIAADARLTPTDYADDQIWELSLAGGEPPALALRTSFGLRARDLRLFPRFTEGDKTASNPTEFVFTPAVRAFYVNYLRVTFEPLEGLGVTAHYWVPNSHTVAGQFTIISHTPQETARAVRFSLAALLKPGENAALMTPSLAETLTLLQGRSGNLEICLALDSECAADTLPHPELTLALELPANAPVVVRWVLAARPQAAEALAQARELFAREWEGEFARIELLNQSLLDIETGDRDWDAALAFSQTVALRSYVGPTAHLPHPSFVFARTPDKGYSRKGDGTDYNWQWDGQVAMEAYVNAPQIAPIAPELAKGVIKNWLTVQDEKGFIDWKPGLGGQRNKALCMPLLASTAWAIYEYTEDVSFLEEIYAGLDRFFDVWFTPKHDRDEDGVPEWTHTIQSAFDEHPLFAKWVRWAQGADITAVEAPDLAAYLYKEVHALIKMARVLNLPEDATLSACAAQLQAAVENMWQDETACYHYVDRDAHVVLKGEELAHGVGSFAVDINRQFNGPVRLLIKALGPRESRPDMVVTLSGRGKRGRHRVETLKRSHVQWYFGMGTAVSDKLYVELERIEISGLPDEFDVQVSVVDLTRLDQTLLLPLWAGMPHPARAEKLVRQTLLNPETFWRLYGIPNTAANEPTYKPDNREGSGGVWLMWNTMVGEGLLEYGFRTEAAELVTRLMMTITNTLKAEKAFREAYNSEKLEGLGERDYIWGIAPLHLFMRVLGVRVISPQRLHLSGHNPFPWPVTVRWKGLTVTRAANSAHTAITFPGGRTLETEAEGFVNG